MRGVKTNGFIRKFMAILLCLCMLTSMVSSVGTISARATEGTSTGASAGYTEDILPGSRVADPTTMDDYRNRLLNTTNGSRYAGRVWTDKTVFAYDADAGKGGTEATEGTGSAKKNYIPLDMSTDGYDGSVGFNSDFAHVFSALASSQVVNEYPPSPVDLVIVFDMSGSMGQDTRYGIDAGGNAYVEHNSNGDNASNPWPGTGVPMSERIQYSRIQVTLEAINQTIDTLMAQNPQNRVAVCGYGANAVVLMPLGHYMRNGGAPYLSVGGMETLYHPSDLVYREPSDGLTSTLGAVTTADWYWMNNRDTCYTVVVNAKMNNYTDSALDSDGSGKTHGSEYAWQVVNKTVSNNIKSDGVKAFPGAWNTDGKTPEGTYGEASRTVYSGSKSTSYSPGSDELINAMNPTVELNADDYVGYFTNTQGGIYLAYKQLADSQATTYSERLSNGVMSTVARIPAAIIMSDGGANFAFNEMGPDTGDYTVDDWNSRYGQKTAGGTRGPDVEGYESNPDDWYMNDNSWDAAAWIDEKDHVGSEGHNKDYSHRLNENIGDEWYNVYLPGDDTLKPGGQQYDEGKYYTSGPGGSWDGLHGMYNTGADYYQDGTLTTAPAWNHAGVLYSSDSDLSGTGGTIMEVLLTASYMNQVVKKHYEYGWQSKNATMDSRVPLSTYTMNVDTEHVPQWGRWRLFPTLDPKEYALDDIGNTDSTGWGAAEPKEKDKKLAETYNGNTWGSGGVYIGAGAFTSLKTSWETWKNGTPSPVSFSMGGNGSIRININRLEESGHTYTAGGGDTVTVTNQDVIDNIAYNDQFYDVTSTNLNNIFDEILDLILGKVFVPVSGDNDAGVGDSITYQDPLGEYMEIKNQSIMATPLHTNGDLVNVSETTYDMALLLFGEMHGLVRTGVYDYHWNNTYMSENTTKEGYIGPELTAGIDALPIGWYLGDPQNAKYSYVNGLPAGYTSAEKAWADGWVLRINYKTLAEYVPIVGINENTMPTEVPDQIKNVVYTVYRFSCNQEDRNTLRRNPIFGAVPRDLQEQWSDTYTKNGGYPDTNEMYRDTPGVYRLSDIRVWVEDSGDYVDETGAIAPESGYDRSLYLNIPAAAVPTELATITLGKDGVLSYKTNLGSDHLEGSSDTDADGNSITVSKEMHKNYCYQSTPLRLFYAVGLEDDLILRDEDGKQKGVDIAALSEEYVAAHTDENNNIWFISNYYSNTRYDNYATDETAYTQGDPTVTFSPSQDNRYYVFQKPLPLYAHAYRLKPGSDGDIAPVDNQTGTFWSGDKSGNGNKDIIWETTKDQAGNDVQQQPGSWIGGTYMGVYKSADAFKNAYKTAKDNGGTLTDSLGAQYPLVEDGIVFLADDLLEHVTTDPEDESKYAEGSISFSSDDYFFILVEYYLPNGEIGKDNNNKEVPGTTGGHLVQHVAARKGSEFGSGFHSEQIDNGSMLCWTDTNSHLNLEIDYLSRSVTGDDTRGEPTFEKLTYQDEDLRTYLEGLGIKEELIDKQVEYWENLQANPLVKTALNAAKTNESDSLSKYEFEKYFKFAVAARPGGIRTGDMANNRQPKTQNVTGTAYSYYLPTVSSNSGTDDNVVINNYLGNNGILKVANQSLLVTKLFEAPEGFMLTPSQKEESFLYQLFVEDLVGDVNATMVHYNPFSGTWQRQLAYIDVLTDNSSLLLDSSSQRALFAREVNGEGTTIGARQVVAVTEDGKTVYYFANEDGTASKESFDGTALYYLYLPSNRTEENAENLVRRLYQDPAYSDGAEYDTNKNSLTIYCKETSGLKDTDNINYNEVTENRPAGTFAYWAQDAELIPVNVVKYAEEKGSEGSEAAGGSSWQHDRDGTEAHYGLGYFTLVVSKPLNATSENAISSPFSTRTMYMTKTLTFGKNAAENSGDHGDGSESGTSLTENDLYDKIIPKADRPDFNDSKYTADYIAKHTAEFALKSGEGLLLTGLQDRIDYRFTEKLTQEQMEKGYVLKEVEHIQQIGSSSVYRPGTQQIPVYTKEGATYGTSYPASESGKKTQNNLTWKYNADKSVNTDATVQYEPFNHTNAIMWESYATMGAGQLGNHHHPEDSLDETADFYDGDTNTGIKQTVQINPSCATCDVKQEDDSIIHYIYRDGELVDPHYEGEWSAYLRDAYRYIVGPTVHFGMDGETQADANAGQSLPAKTFEKSNGVYSVFGNTGYFEEQAHFINTYEPLPSEKTETTPGDGELVGVGDSITYEIHWENYSDEKEHIIVMDTLDPGVTFISSTGNYTKDATGQPDVSVTGDGEDPATGQYFKESGIYTYEMECILDDGTRGTKKEQLDVPAHTVVWDLKTQAALTDGYVSLTVQVNENARLDYSYNEEATGFVSDKDESGNPKNDYEVFNQARVKVGNNSFLKTEIVENPVPDKTESTPGDGKLVGLGEEITYKIHWENSHDKKADVIITDPLDPGVDFVSASFDGVTLPAAADGESTWIDNVGIGSDTGDDFVVADGNGQIKISIAYDKDSHTVTWTFTAQALANTEPDKSGVFVGDVELKVRVNENAVKKWSYGFGDTPDVDDTKDYEVQNRAKVEVDNKSVYTEIVENPVPEKTESDPGDGEIVGIGDQITYQIGWANTKDQPATVVITDPLDPGVDFVSASYKGVTLYAATVGGHVDSGDGDSAVGKLLTIEIDYDDADKHIVTWTLRNVEAGSTGTVELKVSVNKNAMKSWSYGDSNGSTPDTPIENDTIKDYEVQNRAKVEVDNKPVYTEIVENPVPEKTESDPGDGEIVGIGDEITYQIDWANTKDQPATVVITDPLDPGVDFVSAFYGGGASGITLNADSESGHVDSGDGDVLTDTSPSIEIDYDAGKHTVTWTLRNVEEQGNREINGQSQ